MERNESDWNGNGTETEMELKREQGKTPVKDFKMPHGNLPIYCSSIFI
jgi:hypothetical protein